MSEGKLILLVGSSGSGKGTLFAHVRDMFPDLLYPTSWTTRAPRPGENNATGKPYKFVTTEEFEAAKDQNTFLEWDHHFHNYYGTPAKEITDGLVAKRAIFHELEIRGVRQLLAKLPREQIQIIFISGGSWEDIKKRILGRDHVSEQELEKRKAHYDEEVFFAKDADYIVENLDGKLEEAKEALGKIVESILR